MRKKILSALLLGLFTVASTSTFVSCKDYDDDISNLQEQITKNNTDLTKLVNDKIAIVDAEIQKVNDALDAAEKACADADKKLQANIDAANKAITDGDAATLAAAKKAVEDAMVQVAATYATKAELQKAQSDLEAAYKAADELIKADVKSNKEEIAKLLAADEKLNAAVNTAQATADKALTLAENIKATYATKDELAAKIAEVNTSLNTVKSELEAKIGENLQEISALKTRAGNIESDVEANKTAISTLNELTEKHTKTLESLNSHMLVVCDSLKTLDAKIAANATRIEFVKDSLATAYTQAIQGATQTLNASISASNVRIDSLKGAVNDTLKNVKDRIATAEKNIGDIEDSIQSVKDRVEAIESRLAIINADLSNLITSIIYNGQTKNAVVYGTMDANKFAGNTRFPYNAYKGADSIKLINDSSLMTVNNGLVYATINPAEIDFAGSSVKIVNSQNKEHALFSLGKAQLVTESDPILTITRTAPGFGNGLYKFEIEAKKSGIKSSEFVGPNSVYATAATPGTAQNACIAYALQAEYKAGDSSRTVTSHYDLAIVPQKATPVTDVDLKAVKPGQDVTGKPYTMKFELADKDSIAGSFKFDKTSSEVFAAYVELDTAGNAEYIKFKDVKLSQNKVLKGKDIETPIVITAPESLLNEAIPVKGYVLNYDGSIKYTTNEAVVFTRSIFGTINVEVSDTLSQSTDKILDITDAVIAQLKAKKGDDAAKLFAKHAALPLDSVKSNVYRIHVETAGDTINNTFKYVPKALKFVNNKCVLTQPMEFVDATGLKVATINYTLTVILPETYDKLNMRIGSAFNVIDTDKDYSKDYTVAWANNVNPVTKKVNYLWDTHSFNIARFTTLAAAKGDATSYIDYEAPDAAQYNDFQKRTAEATDSVKVQNIRVYASNDVLASNTNAGAAPVGDNDKVRFKINQNIHFFGLANAYKTHDTFWYSVVSPINYGIFRGGKKEVEATCNNVGYCEAPLDSFVWKDYSNNMKEFKINDNRIKSVTCKLIEDTSNNYALVLNKTITVNTTDNRLEFTINKGAATSECILTIEIHILDMWGIESVIKGEIKVDPSQAKAKKH